MGRGAGGYPTASSSSGGMGGGTDETAFGAQPDLGGIAGFGSESGGIYINNINTAVAQAAGRDFKGTGIKGPVGVGYGGMGKPMGQMGNMGSMGMGMGMGVRY